MGNRTLKYLGLKLGFLGCSKISLLKCPGSSRTVKNLVVKSKEETTCVSGILCRLHPDIIFVILSWLPAKSLLRMRCVCKNWHAFTQERRFIDQHISRGVLRVIYYKTPEASNSSGSAAFICARDGLFLYRSIATGKCCIKNAAIKQQPQLPGPHNKKSLAIKISFVPSIGHYKLVSISRTSKGETCSENYEVLTVGIDDSWRTVKPPKLDIVNRKLINKLWFISIVGAVHCIRLSKIGSNNCLEIVSLDLESERFTVAVLPQDLIPYGKEVLPLVWNGQLAFSYRVRKILNVLVLENYKDPKWGKETIAVPLKFEASEETLNNLVPLSIQQGHLWFWYKKFSYNIASGRFNFKIAPSKDCNISFDKFLTHKERLVTLRGMQPCV